MNPDKSKQHQLQFPSYRDGDHVPLLRVNDGPPETHRKYATDKPQLLHMPTYVYGEYNVREPPAFLNIPPKKQPTHVMTPEQLERNKQIIAQIEADLDEMRANDPAFRQWCEDEKKRFPSKADPNSKN
jgi:hypothetical protein